MRYSGCLIKLLDLNVHEILCLAEPRDLLALARTSTTFRAHLRSNACVPIWRHVYQNIGDSYQAPEELPTWLDGPTLTRLLFEPQCSFCGSLKPAAHGYHVLLAIGQQCCMGCYGRRHFVTYSAALKQLGSRNRVIMKSLCMFSNPAAGAGVPAQEDPRRGTPSLSGMTRQMYRSVMYAAVEVEALCARLKAAPDPAAREAVRAAAEIDVSHRRRVSARWSQWLLTARARRKLDVVARLGVLPGTPYHLELQHMREDASPDGLQFWQHPVMLAPQRLTDEEWDRAQDALTQTLLAVRPRRCRRAREAALQAIVVQMLNQHPGSGWAANSLWYLQRADVQALLARAGAPDALEARIATAFGIPVDAEAQLDGTQAYIVVARLHWRADMGVCQTAGCQWTARGVKHMGELDEASARDTSLD